MKVFIVERDVPYEFSQVVAVKGTREEAEQCKERAEKRPGWKGDGTFTINEWEVGEEL